MPLLDYFNRIRLWFFHRSVILNSLEKRKGQCKMCGRCCEFFGFKCPLLNKKNKCRIYKFRPFLLCRIPPLNITKGEIDKHRKVNCGYYWENGRKKSK